MKNVKFTPEHTPYIRTSQPAIRLKLGEEMSINRKVLYALSNPEHICFWWSESHRILFISAVEEETPLSFKVNKRYYTTKTGYKVGRREFLQAVMSIAGWNSKMICAAVGEYIPDLDMVAFKLDDAEIMEIRSGDGYDR